MAKKNYTPLPIEPYFKAVGINVPVPFERSLGRPTKLTIEAVKKAIEYYIELRGQEKIPFVEGLADRLGVCRATIYVWIEKAQQDNDPLAGAFLDTINLIMNLQSWRLQEYGLYRKVHPGMAQMLLNTRHGFIMQTKIAEGQDSETIGTLQQLKQLYDEFAMETGLREAGGADSVQAERASA